MSMRYKGGVISATPPTTSTSAATGVWTLVQQMQAQGAGTWPSQPGPYFIGALGNTSGAESYGIAVDSSSNVYIAGYVSVSSRETGQLAKYSASGTLQWQRNLSSGGGNVSLRCIAVDSSNNVYVAGYLPGTGIYDCLIAKYDSSGAIQWQRSLGITSGAVENFLGIAVDSSGNVYATGSISGGADAIVTKYNTSGILQWQQAVNSSSSGDLALNGIAVDSSGNVYVAGYWNNGYVTYDVLIAKYNTSGTLQWQRVLDGGSNDFGYGIAVDSSGNVYVGGYSAVSGTYHFQLEKYSTGGVIQWQRSLSSANTDQALAVAVDSSGNVYISGLSSGNGALIAKYNTSGTIQWQRKLGTGSTSKGLSVDSLGNFYIAGSISTATTGTYNMLVAKLPGDGSLTGTYTIGGTSYTYAASTLTDATTSYSTSTSSLTSSAGTLTSATSTLTDAATSLTSSVTTL